MSALLLALLGAGCGDAARPNAAATPLLRPKAGTASQDHAAHRHRELPGDTLPGESLYQLEGAWTLPDGASAELSSLRGSPVLLLLFYGTCDAACPVLIHDLERVDALLAPEARKAVRFALVSFDPERDTPEKLAALARSKGWDARWRLLHGDSEQVRELAAAVGVRYRPSGGGQFSHTLRIVLLGRDGAPLEHWDGLTRPVEPIAARVSALTAQGRGESY